MEPEKQTQAAGRGSRRGLLLWTAIVVGAFCLHYAFHWHHAEGRLWQCPVFALPPFGTAWAAGLLLGRLWRGTFRAQEKVMATVLLTLAAGAIVGFAGWVWLVVHLTW